MVTPSIGWALGEHYVLRTTDGGRHWRRLLHLSPMSGTGGSNLGESRLTTVGSTTAWVALPTGGGRTTCDVLRTVNGGKTWIRTGPLPGGCIFLGSFQFVDPRHGWLLEYGTAATGDQVSHTIIRTLDGGAHWNVVERSGLGTSGGTPHALATCGFVANLTFETPDEGWATGECEATPQLQSLFRTSDGGRSWSRIDLLVPAGFHFCRPSQPKCTGYVATYPPRFEGGSGMLVVSFGPPTAFAAYVVRAGEPMFYHTSVVRVPTAPGVAFDLSPVQAVATATPILSWVLVHSTLYATHDAGLYWAMSARHPGLGRSPSMQFQCKVPTQELRRARCTGFAFDTGNTFLQVSRDGGRTWNRVYANAATG
jgi:photosystem II stability/assembly factor-like uncharacterized protein